MEKLNKILGYLQFVCIILFMVAIGYGLQSKSFVLAVVCYMGTIIVVISRFLIGKFEKKIKLPLTIDRDFNSPLMDVFVIYGCIGVIVENEGYWDRLCFIILILFIIDLIRYVLRIIQHNSISKLQRLLSNLRKINNSQLNIENVFSEQETSIEWLRARVKLQINNIVDRVNPKNNKVPESLLSSVVYKKFKISCSTSDEKLNDMDWDNLSQIVNALYPGFNEKLQLFCKEMSDYEYRVCLLVKCGFGNGEIGKLTNHEKSSVSTTRGRLYKKCFMEKGSAADFDCFILSL